MFFFIDGSFYNAAEIKNIYVRDSQYVNKRTGMPVSEVRITFYDDSGPKIFFMRWEDVSGIDYYWKYNITNGLISFYNCCEKDLILKNGEDNPHCPQCIQISCSQCNFATRIDKRLFKQTEELNDPPLMCPICGTYLNSEENDQI